MKLVLLIYILALLEARRVWFYYPDLLVGFLLPLSSSLPLSSFVPLAFFAGILRDGMRPEIFWISPIFFILIGILGTLFKNFINPRLLFPKFFFYFSVSLVYLFLYFSLHRVGMGINLIVTSLSTSIFSLLINLIFIRK